MSGAVRNRLAVGGKQRYNDPGMYSAAIVACIGVVALAHEIVAIT